MCWICVCAVVADFLGGQVPVGGAQLGSRERVCVCLRRAVSLLRLHLSVTVALLNVLYEGEPPPAVYVLSVAMHEMMVHVCARAWMQLAAR